MNFESWHLVDGSNQTEVEVGDILTDSSGASYEVYGGRRPTTEHPYGFVVVCRVSDGLVSELDPLFFRCRWEKY